MQRLSQRLTSLLWAPLRAYDVAAKKNPATVGIMTTLIKTSAADVFAQKIVEKREEIDWRRNAVFGAFGFAYLGVWQYYLYTNVFTRITPAIQAVVGPRGVGAALTFIDQCIHHPVLYFPCFYLLRGGMAGEAPAESLGKYKVDAWENMKALWAVWVPAQLVNFSVVPMHLRIPFVAGVSFMWTVILSCLRGALEPAQARMAESVTVYADDGQQRHHHHAAARNQQQPAAPATSVPAAAKAGAEL
mmetsp:Transcript_8372/g.20845  ORF Transcript_8372/g.20845 Transcript_8372/m.20845 type:complete len:245 (-) Transcript_8372:771-1505(-)|eukprot:CAMPEP_0202868750 /NCGR_PEP_ID=MMETSP1391-20130828/11052_1 /ASSEMBLY_ACC=CAM_ASM_000867 /TAXON_ID=1034604 /ORGANISM="Chlamydomonas leiostraca, Strain SAG 11-49" /LENGTH=244 /DNA_ID=CAMNT_0049548955 /DNA_START=282 /DNA_END=1016 /DNA_ORIENTATION=-